LKFNAIPQKAPLVSKSLFSFLLRADFIFILFNMSSKANSPSRTSLSLSSRKSFRNDLFISVAVTGEAGSYTSSAAKTFFSPYSSNVNYNSVSNVRELLESIKRGDNIYGITPLESSSYGTIHAVYDRLLLSQGRFTIVGEIGQIEEHCLCVRNDFMGSEVDICRIFSHPHIIECCSDSLDSIDKRRSIAGLDHITRENSWDSIAACRDVLKSDVNEAVACICSREAAELHDLKVLNSSVGNYKNAEVSQSFSVLFFLLIFLVFSVSYYARHVMLLLLKHQVKLWKIL
jgi:hypothetical protein